VSCPSSESEFRPRVAGLTVWWVVGATWGVAREFILRVF
jgi:hypothetical protein